MVISPSTLPGTSGNTLTSNGTSIISTRGGNLLWGTASGTITQGKLVIQQSDGTFIQLTGSNTAITYANTMPGSNYRYWRSTILLQL
jgi:hypothetical protein